MRSTSFEAMWKDLAALGRDPRTGGYRRYAWTPALRACESWFTDEAGRRGLTLEADGNGNAVAWWRPGPLRLEGGVITGSHLDSVPDGGAYDGPLGVVSALAAVDVLCERGVRPSRPLGIAVFIEEEGARFGLSCLGSRLMTGALAADQANLLRDADGTQLPEAVAAMGLEPRFGPSLDLLCDPVAFVELHIEQGRALADLDAPVGLATGIWPHGRWRFTFTGEANHAGTTRMADRRDPMLTYAMTALAANKRARLAETGTGEGSGARATFGRVEVAPNGVNAIAGTVTAWLDARAADETALQSLVDDIMRQAHDRAARDGTTLAVVAESVTPAVAFDERLRARLVRRLGDLPMLPTQAGHDAGILATAGVPAAMLFVRNPTGVSHSPTEYADPADCLAGVHALADALEELLT
ncbi:allantoate amidohydrolase [Actinopolymorpha sp. B17G11]|uniref:allantoate amidohydrolase n=1 Tax=Actinopolymorpha sp. B17G11 TaxID=3160861 RepID=UPI0032E4BF83